MEYYCLKFINRCDKMRKFLIIILIAACFLPAIVLAQGNGSKNADQTDQYINVIMQRQRIPGLSLAVLKNGNVIKMKAYGTANIETNTPATI